MKAFGADVQNIVIECHTKEFYEKMLKTAKCSSDIIDICKSGRGVNAVDGYYHPQTFYFYDLEKKRGKEFNINAYSDFYATQIGVISKYTF